MAIARSSSPRSARPSPWLRFHAIAQDQHRPLPWRKILQAGNERQPQSLARRVCFALASDYATGQHLGVFGLGLGLAETLGPGVLIALCITWGPTRLVRRRRSVSP